MKHHKNHDNGKGRGLQLLSVGWVLLGFAWLGTGTFLWPCHASDSDALGMWHLRSPLPTVRDLNAVAYGSGRYVAVGDFGTIVSSTNGVDWILGARWNTNNLYTVSFLEGRFYLGGVGTLLWSEDGANWHDTDVVPAHGAVRTVAFGRGTNNPAGLFLAIAEDSYWQRPSILQSQDGTNWVNLGRAAFPYPRPFVHSLAFGNDRFVSASTSSPELPLPTPLTLAYSPDGINWYLGNVSGGALAFGNGEFVSTSGFPSSSTSSNFIFAAMHSTSGIAWSGRILGWLQSGLCHGAGRFVAVGGNAKTARSVDGVTWEFNQAPQSAGLRGVTFGDGQYVAVGQTGAILTSPDGANWTQQGGPFLAKFSAPAPYRESGFVIVGASGTLLVSTNGAEWQQLPTGTSRDLLSVAEGAGWTVVVGTEGLILSGAELSGLIPRTSGTTNDLADVAYGAGRWVAVGTGGIVLASANAEDWEARASGTLRSFSRVIYANGRFVAGGEAATLAVSDDGLSWRSTNVAGLAGSGTLHGLAGAHGRFVATAGTVVMVSTNAWDWRIANPKSYRYYFDTFWGLGYGSGRFIVTSSWPAPLFSSADGETWMEHSADSEVAFVPRWSRTAYNNGVFLGAGGYGIILQSDVLSFLNLSREGTLNRLTIEGPLNQGYRIDVSDGLGSPWQELKQLPAHADAVHTFEETSGNGTNRLYRAVGINKN